MTCRFFVGTHQPQWLEVWDVPLFVSRRRLFARKSLPVALGPWALDSGGFTELDTKGFWSVSAEDYAADVERFQAEMGNLQWAAPQDWMCEPRVRKKSLKSVVEHQELTVANFVELSTIASTVPWAPVLQGWALADYVECIEMYSRQGVDLWRYPVVGVGSVCRRQASLEIRDILRELHGYGLKLHGFGVKLKGLELSAEYLVSADSMAWSIAGRYDSPLPGCKHSNCANCILYAERWRDRIMQIPGVV